MTGRPVPAQLLPKEQGLCCNGSCLHPVVQTCCRTLARPVVRVQQQHQPPQHTSQRPTPLLQHCTVCPPRCCWRQLHALHEAVEARPGHAEHLQASRGASRGLA